MFFSLGTPFNMVDKCLDLYLQYGTQPISKLPYLANKTWETLARCSCQLDVEAQQYSSRARTLKPHLATQPTNHDFRNKCNAASETFFFAESRNTRLHLRAEFFVAIARCYIANSSTVHVGSGHKELTREGEYYSSRDTDLRPQSRLRHPEVGFARTITTKSISRVHREQLASGVKWHHLSKLTGNLDPQGPKSL